MAFEPSPAVVQVAPSNPSGTVSGTYVLMGLAVAGATAFTITPQASGRILVMVSGIMNDGTTAMTCTAQLRYGTGTAPVNGAADTGTAAGGQIAFITLTGVLQCPFALQAVVSGLSVPSITPLRQTGTPTPVWLDVACKVSSANSFTITSLSCTAFEL